jgi:hypothetical protein
MQNQQAQQDDGEPEMQPPPVVPIHAPQRQTPASAMSAAAGREGVTNDQPRARHGQHEHQRYQIDQKIECVSTHDSLSNASEGSIFHASPEDNATPCNYREFLLERWNPTAGVRFMLNPDPRVSISI